MNNQTVLITGSSRGIGKDIAVYFAKNNFNVILNCKSSIDEMNLLRDELLQYNTNILAIQCDVSIYDECVKMFDTILQQFNKIDVVINNAGISQIGLFTDTPPNELQNVITNNLTSYINISHLATKHMLHHKSGSIINISSIWGNVGASCEVLYSTSKAGINGLTKSLAKELAPSNIFVNAIACGIIDTAMNNNILAYDMEQLIDDIPLCRLGTGNDIASLCYYLATSNTYMTGQILTVDGGYI